MPEQVHLLLWPLLREFPVSALTCDMKRQCGREVIARWRTLNAAILQRLVAPDGKTRFWQRGGGYDRNEFSTGEIAETIAYIHNNPVKRGLVARAVDWPWSSARWYARERGGGGEIDPMLPKRPSLRFVP